jgi:enoyl-CoA hydratase/carnithine racemase
MAPFDELPPPRPLSRRAQAGILADMKEQDPHNLLPPGCRSLRLPAPFVGGVAAGGVGWLVVNRPEKRNAFSRAMWAALPDVLERLAAVESLRVLVMRGAGGHFGAGADISEFAEARTGAAAKDYEQVHDRALAALAAFRTPVIAMIEGYCMGGALALALACDLRLAAEDAVFALPPARLGLAFPLSSLRRLLMAVSHATAMEMLFTGRRYDAGWALSRGLVNEVRATAELPAAVGLLAETIAANAPLAVAHAKAATNALLPEPAAERLAALEALAARCLNSEDYAEGCRAFLERRRPVFRGR